MSRCENCGRDCGPVPCEHCAKMATAEAAINPFEGLPTTPSEWQRFLANPLEWLQEWNDKNGDVVFSRSSVTNAYAVRLHVADMPMPISTGVALTVEAAMKNAIDGLDAVAHMG